MKNLLWLFLACLIAVPPASAATLWSASGMSPNCDLCSDLPQLYRELLEQEFLLRHFESVKKQQYFPQSIKQLQSSAGRKLTAAMRGNLFGVLAPAGNGGGGGSGPAAAAAYGTDLNTCGLVEYTIDRNFEPIEAPITPANISGRLCRPLAEFLIAHEGQHQASCRAAGRNKASLEEVKFFVDDDIKAYRAGIEVLRKHIADLAVRCLWKGSAGNPNRMKKDVGRVVPLPEEIDRLQHNIAKPAKVLKRATH